MLLSTSCLCYLIWDPCYIVRCQLVPSRSQTQLTLLTSSAEEKSTYVVNKCRVIAACTNLFDISSIVLIKVDHDWSIGDSFGCVSTLPKVIVTPRKDLTIPCCN